MKKLLAAVTVLALVSGCRIQVDKSKDGQDKNVKIDTPLGGLHVRAGDTSAADVGLPAYPGAQIVPDKDGDKSADVHFGFGEWQFRVKAVHYETGDPQENVVAFYRKALGRYGDVIECQGNQAVGSPAATREGLTCSDDKGNTKVHVSEDSSLSLRAGSRHHQHIFALDKDHRAETRFSLVELQLPEGIDKGPQESN
ncbi:MAG TPA: hypothetical protein VK670_09180 [Silvibacterium sp.]|nr:hypothetical protein [Silvibacterium sp.]